MTDRCRACRHGMRTVGPLRGANIGSADVIRFAGSPRGGRPASDRPGDVAALCRSASTLAGMWQSGAGRATLLVGRAPLRLMPLREVYPVQAAVSLDLQFRLVALSALRDP